MPTLTVFTPTYNRAHTLPRTYESLKMQDCKDFVWLIIDDGSTDQTNVLVKQWIEQDNGFEIRYIYKKNGGMHTAHNVAYENIETEINVCIDSDDCMARGAVRKIIEKWAAIRNQGYAGIIGLDADMNGKIIGKGFRKGVSETTLSGYYASGGKGDKKLVYCTEIIKSYTPYPVFKGERYIALAYKYRLIDQDYKLAVLNSVLCNVEYQQDGSSATMWLQYLRSPKGFACWRKLCLKYPESFSRLIIDCIHYTAESIIAHNRNYIIESPRPCLTLLTLVPGLVLAYTIRHRAGV